MRSKRLSTKDRFFKENHKEERKKLDFSAESCWAENYVKFCMKADEPLLVHKLDGVGVELVTYSAAIHVELWLNYFSFVSMVF